jgi:hypothetical protein
MSTSGNDDRSGNLSSNRDSQSSRSAAAEGLQETTILGIPVALPRQVGLIFLVVSAFFAVIVFLAAQVVKYHVWADTMREYLEVGSKDVQQAQETKIAQLQAKLNSMVAISYSETVVLDFADHKSIQLQFFGPDQDKAVLYCEAKYLDYNLPNFLQEAAARPSVDIGFTLLDPFMKLLPNLEDPGERTVRGKHEFRLPPSPSISPRRPRLYDLFVGLTQQANKYDGKVQLDCMLNLVGYNSETQMDGW